MKRLRSCLGGWLLGLAALGAVTGLRAEDLSTTIAGKFPTVRALVVAHEDCIAVEYYRKDVRRETMLPVYSVTRSVLSILDRKSTRLNSSH